MKRVSVVVALALALSTTAAWSYFQLIRAGHQMGTAAEKFLAALNDEQRQKASLDYNAPERVDWHFIPKNDGDREGLQVRDMNEGQRKAAFELLKAALSEVGYSKATKIMELENLLAELQRGKSGPLRDPERYFFTVYGQPSAEGKWGLSVEGHHLSLNFVVDKGNVVSSSPAAFCTNPAIVMSDGLAGIPRGTRVLDKEETLAFELLDSLTADQRKEAVIADKAPSEIRAAGEPQPPQEKPAGIAAEKLTGQQRSTLLSLIQSYADNMPKEVAEARMEPIRNGGMAQVHFAWAGADKPGVGHYYRVQGETFLIEFVNVQPDSAGNPANHIHSIWRDMRGDFALPASE
jgi:hypothetical protein